MSESALSSEERHLRALARFDAGLERLAQARPLTRSLHQPDLFQAADQVLESPRGLADLYERADRFDESGVFEGGPWADPQRLQPPLVRGCLEGVGLFPLLETLSELRMLALALGRARSDRVGPEEARAFLEQVMALNLDLVFPTATEASRVEGRARHEALFGFLARELGLANLRSVVAREVEQVCLQRPILTERAREMIRLAADLPPQEDDGDALLGRFVAAASGSTALARAHPTAAGYRAALRSLDPDALGLEAERFGESLRETGIAAPHHAVLLRRLRSRAPELLAPALGLNRLGAAELEQNVSLAHDLLRVAIVPATCGSIYGFARVLERGLLSRSEVAAGLRRLVELDLCPTARRNLQRKARTHQGLTPNQVLLAGALSVLGQPLGIGQGRNPTCQAARGISLWSQHAPGFLLGMLASAARDDLVQLRFEGDTLSSGTLQGGLAGDIDLDLDPVSMVLVPHLDRLYDEMMRRCQPRPEDGHKWANPGLYGRWVPHGFASVLDKLTGAIVDYDDFVRRFYATHHPAYNDGYELAYPNPVGLFVTTSRGDLLGLHAVSVQRIAQDPGGELRVYFYNPNNEGRQDWGQGITPSIAGQGELEGESSLPFHHFAARLYAFHYNPFEEGDAFAVPTEVIREVEALARQSWGKAYRWV